MFSISHAAWLICHLKQGPPAIYLFHTSLFIHSLKQDKGSRLPALNRLSLTSESTNHCHLLTLAASLSCWVMFEQNPGAYTNFSQLVANLHTKKCEKHPLLEPIVNCPPSSSRAVWVYYGIIRLCYMTVTLFFVSFQ